MALMSWASCGPGVVGLMWLLRREPHVALTSSGFVLYLDFFQLDPGTSKCGGGLGSQAGEWLLEKSRT